MSHVFRNPEVAPYRVTDLPRSTVSQPELLQYAGLVPVTKNNQSNLFFWLFYNTTLIPDSQARENRNRKLIVWFNGGPGCTSMDGVFLENGPYQFSEATDKVEARPWSLTGQAAMLYLDQPLGTGYSYAPTSQYNRNYVQVTETFVQFLQRFYTLFPELTEFDLYLGGESQAGVYIPYIAQEILRRANMKVDPVTYPLKGIVVGNGWFDPGVQYRALFDMLHTHQLLPTDVEPQITPLLDKCEVSYRSNPPLLTDDNCENYVSKVLELAVPEKGKCYNAYDYRFTDDYPACGMNWPPKIHTFTQYFRLPEVWKALHVDQREWHKWVECNSDVGNHLKKALDRPTHFLLPDLLQRLDVLLFAGDKDLLCNYLGLETLIDQLEWGGHRGFRASEFASWRIDSHEVGKYQSERNLTYVRLLDASHMAGVDKPKELFDLVSRFTRSDRSHLPYRSVIRYPNGNDVSYDDDVTKRGGHFLLGTLVTIALVLASFGLGFWWWTRRRRQRRFGNTGSFYHPVDNEQQVNMDNTRVSSKQRETHHAKWPWGSDPSIIPPPLSNFNNPMATTMTNSGEVGQTIPMKQLDYRDEFLLDDDTASDATEDENDADLAVYQSPMASTLRSDASSSASAKGMGKRPSVF
ncbi:Cell death protease [Dispira parvispora]|uniref:Pheromone-processing carboxypeptidase KEX1 n=1 Tax=Dispira parvispora TaxID=1520584 RepID=A0A9W8AMR2_9FUNG|nr:Cell death protease [Dispira parvispora]